MTTLGACGDNQPLCTFTEAADATNDVTGETSGVTTGGDPVGLCGIVDDGHFTGGTLRTVDIDTYAITVGGTGDLRIDLVADPGIEVLDSFTASISTDAANPQLIAAVTLDTSLADHAAGHAQLTPGAYQVAVTALANGDLSASTLGYRVELTPDPLASCPADTHRADYTESADGAGATDNDTFEVDFTKAPPFAMVAGTPEVTGLAIDADASTRISGTALLTSATLVHEDQYLDRDTYEIATSDATNELTVRVDWSDSMSDLDFVVFEEGSLVPSVVANTTSTTGPELAVFAVKPRTKYLVWVGSFLGSSTTLAYDVTLCGAHFLN